MKVWKAEALLLIGILFIGTLWLLGKNQPHIHRLAEPQTSPLVWIPFSPDTFQKSIQSGRPTLLDFWAEWCGPCHLMEESTFTDEGVIAELNSWNLIRVDATESTEEIRKIFDEFSVEALPTMIFIDTKGKENISERVRGFEEPDQFLSRLKKIREANSSGN